MVHVARGHRRAGDRHDSVARPEQAGGAAVLDDRANRRRRHVADRRLRRREAADRIVAVDVAREQHRGEQDERQQQVDRRSGEDHDDPLPGLLHVVAALGHAQVDARQLIRRHPGDLHVAAERQHADLVVRLAAAKADEPRREEQREALDAHADRLGGDEVAGLVRHDQRTEAGDRDHPRHDVVSQARGLKRA